MLSHLDQGQAHQRCLRKFEALVSICLQENLQALVLLDCGQLPPVVLHPWQLYPLVYDLEWLVTTSPTERRYAKQGAVLPPAARLA